jgi:hypothetical protein
MKSGSPRSGGSGCGLTISPPLSYDSMMANVYSNTASASLPLAQLIGSDATRDILQKCVEPVVERRVKIVCSEIGDRRLRLNADRRHSFFRFPEGNFLHAILNAKCAAGARHLEAPPAAQAVNRIASLTEQIPYAAVCKLDVNAVDGYHHIS